MAKTDGQRLRVVDRPTAATRGADATNRTANGEVKRAGRPVALEFVAIVALCLTSLECRSTTGIGTGDDASDCAESTYLWLHSPVWPEVLASMGGPADVEHRTVIVRSLSGRYLTSSVVRVRRHQSLADLLSSLADPVGLEEVSSIRIGVAGSPLTDVRAHLDAELPRDSTTVTIALADTAPRLAWDRARVRIAYVCGGGGDDGTYHLPSALLCAMLARSRRQWSVLDLPQGGDEPGRTGCWWTTAASVTSAAECEALVKSTAHGVAFISQDAILQRGAVTLCGEVEVPMSVPTLVGPALLPARLSALASAATLTPYAIRSPIVLTSATGDKECVGVVTQDGIINDRLLGGVLFFPPRRAGRVSP